jgi:D-ribose pyranase
MGLQFGRLAGVGSVTIGQTAHKATTNYLPNLSGDTVKHGGIVRRPEANALARLGHTNLVVRYDARILIPPDAEAVDLEIRFGVPPFEFVLTRLLEALVAEDAAQKDSRNLAARGMSAMAGYGLAFVPLDESKGKFTEAKLVGYVGETTNWRRERGSTYS